MKIQGLATVTMIALGMAAPAMAESNEKLSEADSVATIPEIIVTAEKRQDNIQKVPAAITAVTGADLARAGVEDMLAMNKVAPEVLISRVGPGDQIELRGVFSNDFAPSSEPPNSIAIDGAPIIKATALEGMIYDLARVEVLKGPQGTLYGRNSTGGSINFIPNHPNFTSLSAMGELEGGNQNLLRGTFMVNVPVNDSIAFRAAFQSYSHDGYFHSGLDDANQRSGRFSLLFAPTDNDKLLVTADLAEINSKGDGVQTIVGRYLGPQGGSNKGLAYTIASDPWNDTAVWGNAAPYHYDSTNRGIMAQYDRDLEFATLTVQLAERQFHSTPIIAVNFLNANYAGTPGTGPAGGATVSPNAPYFDPTLPYGSRGLGPVDFHSDTVEARLTSQAKQPLEWVVGINGLYSTDAGESRQFATQTSTVPTTIVQNLNDKTRSGAIFGQGTYTPASLSRLHFTAGARYTADHKTGTTATYVGNGVTPPALQNGIAGLAYWSPSWTAVTSRFAINYDLTPSAMVYVSRATGYKAGGIGFGPTPLYAPEHNTAYEVGLKSRLLDDRLQFNVGAYTYHYTDFEETVSYAIGNTTTRINTVANAGEANMYGAEFDVQYLPTSHDGISLNFAAERAKYGQNAPTIPPYSATGTTSATTNTLPPILTGTTIPGVPQWVGNASYSHTFDLANNNGDLTARVDTQFRGKMLLGLVNANYPNATFPAAPPEFSFYSQPWALFDASLKYSPDNRAWSISIYGRNLFDRVVYQSGGLNGSVGLLTAVLAPPRTIGAVVSARF